MARRSFHIAILPGDGIGVEVMDACLFLLERLTDRLGGPRLAFERLPAGAFCYRDTGEAFPPRSLERVQAADAILFGAMGWPDFRYPDGTEIAPQLDLRTGLNLYAGLRPIRLLPGVHGPLRDPRAATIDFVIVRESTERLSASRGLGRIEGDERAADTQVITRAGSERIIDFAVGLARRRKARGHTGQLTRVDKANVFASFAFFRRIFAERTSCAPEIAAEARYVDAMALDLVRKPWEFDVLVTENMFGDILSDLGAGLVGGMGFAPSADIGDCHAVFQPAHGSAPDIANRGIANPTAMVLSAALMLDWLGEQHGCDQCTRAGVVLDRAVRSAFADGTARPYDLGGNQGTKEVATSLAAALERVGRGPQEIEEAQ
jgi:3-isopropylmalate dehydrogenase